MLTNRLAKALQAAGKGGGQITLFRRLAGIPPRRLWAAQEQAHVGIWNSHSP